MCTGPQVSAAPHCLFGDRLQNFPTFIKLALVNPSHSHPCQRDQEQIHHSPHTPPHPQCIRPPHSEVKGGGAHSWRCWAIWKWAEFLNTVFWKSSAAGLLVPGLIPTAMRILLGPPGRSPAPAPEPASPRPPPVSIPGLRRSSSELHSRYETPGRPLADAGRGVGPLLALRPVPPGESTWPDPHRAPKVWRPRCVKAVLVCLSLVFWWREAALMSASAKNLAVRRGAEAGRLPRRLRPLHPWDSQLHLGDMTPGPHHPTLQLPGPAPGSPPGFGVSPLPSRQTRLLGPRSGPPAGPGGGEGVSPRGLREREGKPGACPARPPGTARALPERGPRLCQKPAFLEGRGKV